MSDPDAAFTEELESPCQPCPVNPLHDCVALSVVHLEGFGVEAEVTEVSQTDTLSECE